MLDTLIVFDLDFTLWDAGGTWCDHLRPPFRRRNSMVVDGDGAQVCLYPDILRILAWCEEQYHPMALASRTGEPDWAWRLLNLFELSDRFTFTQIYPGSKTRHFRRLQRESGVPYKNMVFFDDEQRNIHDVADLGVTTHHVPEGLTWNLFHSALQQII